MGEEMLELDRAVSWTAQNLAQRRNELCPRCALHPIADDSPFGWCLSCSADRFIAEDEGRVPRSKKLARLQSPRQRSAAIPDEELDDAVEYLVERATLILQVDPELLDYCPRCEEYRIDSNSAEGWCRPCTVEFHNEARVREQRELARKRRWWDEYGDAWRHERKRVARADT